MPSKVIPVIIDNEIYNITIYDQYGNIRHTIFIFIFSRKKLFSFTKKIYFLK